MQLLITQSDIAKVRQLTGRDLETRLKQFIQDAQYLDLQNILCADLFFAVTGDPTAHKDLLNGCDYTYNGQTRHHEGLKTVLSYFAYARFVRFGSAISTAYDMVQKLQDNSQPISEAEKQVIYTENRKIAMTYWGRVQEYLEVTDYSGYKECCKSQQMSGFKTSIIEKR